MPSRSFVLKKESVVQIPSKLVDHQIIETADENTVLIEEATKLSAKKQSIVKEIEQPRQEPKLNLKRQEVKQTLKTRSIVNEIEPLELEAEPSTKSRSIVQEVENLEISLAEPCAELHFSDLEVRLSPSGSKKGKTSLKNKSVVLTNSPVHVNSQIQARSPTHANSKFQTKSPVHVISLEQKKHSFSPEIKHPQTSSSSHSDTSPIETISIEKITNKKIKPPVKTKPISIVQVEERPSQVSSPDSDDMFRRKTAQEALSLNAIAAKVSSIPQKGSLSAGPRSSPALTVDAWEVAVDINADEECSSSLEEPGIRVSSTSPIPWSSPHGSPAEKRKQFHSGQEIAKSFDLCDTVASTPSPAPPSLPPQAPLITQVKQKEAKPPIKEKKKNLNNSVPELEKRTKTSDKKLESNNITDDAKDKVIEDLIETKSVLDSFSEPEKFLKEDSKDPTSDGLSVYNAAIRSSRSPQAGPKFLNLVKAKLKEEQVRSERPKLRRKITKHEKPLYALVMKETMQEYEKQRKASKEELERGSMKRRDHSPNFLNIMEQKLKEKSRDSETIEFGKASNSTVTEPLYDSAIRDTLHNYEERKKEHVRKLGMSQTRGLEINGQLLDRSPSPNFLCMLEENLIEKNLISTVGDTYINDGVCEDEPLYALVIKAALKEFREASKHTGMVKQDVNLPPPPESLLLPETQLSPASVSSTSSMGSLDQGELKNVHSANYDGDHSRSSSDISLASEEVSQINQRFFYSGNQNNEESVKQPKKGKFLKTGTIPGLPMIPSPDYTLQNKENGYDDLIMNSPAIESKQDSPSATASVADVNHPHHIDRPFWDDSKSEIETGDHSSVSSSDSSECSSNRENKKKPKRSSLRKKESVPKLANVSFVKNVEVIDEVVEVDDDKIVRKDLRSESPLKGSPILVIQRKDTPYVKCDVEPHDEVFEEAHKQKEELSKKKESRDECQIDGTEVRQEISVPVVMPATATDQKADSILNLSFNLITTTYPEGKMSIKLVPKGDVTVVEIPELIMQVPVVSPVHTPKRSPPPKRTPPPVNRANKPDCKKGKMSDEGSIPSIPEHNIDVRHGRAALLRTIIPSPDYSPESSPKLESKNARVPGKVLPMRGSSESQVSTSSLSLTELEEVCKKLAPNDPSATKPVSVDVPSSKIRSSSEPFERKLIDVITEKPTVEFPHIPRTPQSSPSNSISTKITLLHQPSPLVGSPPHLLKEASMFDQIHVEEVLVVKEGPIIPRSESHDQVGSSSFHEETNSSHQRDNSPQQVVSPHYQEVLPQENIVQTVSIDQKQSSPFHTHETLITPPTEQLEFTSVFARQLSASPKSPSLPQSMFNRERSPFQEPMPNLSSFSAQLDTSNGIKPVEANLTAFSAKLDSGPVQRRSPVPDADTRSSSAQIDWSEHRESPLREVTTRSSSVPLETFTQQKSPLPQHGTSGPDLHLNLAYAEKKKSRSPPTPLEDLERFHKQQALAMATSPIQPYHVKPFDHAMSNRSPLQETGSTYEEVSSKSAPILSSDPTATELPPTFTTFEPELPETARRSPYHRHQSSSSSPHSIQSPFQPIQVQHQRPLPEANVSSSFVLQAPVPDRSKKPVKKNIFLEEQMTPPPLRRSPTDENDGRQALARFQAVIIPNVM